jgi:hypothetical protein
MRLCIVKLYQDCSNHSPVVKGVIDFYYLHIVKKIKKKFLSEGTRLRALMFAL